MAGKCNRNPMLVGVGAAEAAREFSRALQTKNSKVLPPEVLSLKLVSLEMRGDANFGFVKEKIESLREMAVAAEESGVVVGLGDLKGLMDLDDAVVDCLVAEMKRLLEMFKGWLWVMGWSANYETYIKFVARYPTLDKDWDLQLQLITLAARPAGGGLVTRPPSLMESFVPFGGFFPTAYESCLPVVKSYPISRCQFCNDKYEQEVTTILKGCSPSCEDQSQKKLPSWLQSVDTVGMNFSLNASKVNSDVQLSNTLVVEMQKKWNDHCQRLHHGFPKPEANKHQTLLPIISLPYASNRSINPVSIKSGVTQSQSALSCALPVTLGLQKLTAASHSISPPLVSECTNKDLISKLQNELPKDEQLRTESFGSHQTALSDLSNHDGRTSPPSVTSVTTDLVLGTRHGTSCTEELARGSLCEKVNEVRKHQTLSSSGMAQKLDPSNFKAFYSNFREKVGRQDAAIIAVSQAIVHCRAQQRRRGTSLKGDIWLSFLGPDRFGKKRAAKVLAELMFGSKENMISIDLGFQHSITSRNSVCEQCEMSKSDVSFRGMTIADHIAAEIGKNPSSVVFLENLENADCMVQDRLLQAIQTGKISDGHGREFGTNNAIFVVTTKRFGNRTPRKEIVHFSEENILAVQKWQMKISIESVSETMRRHSTSNILISSRQDSEHKSVPKKRKWEYSDWQKDEEQFCATLKQARKNSNQCLDLNLPVEEVMENDAECSSGSNSTDTEALWVEDFLRSMDENVNFEPFDFDDLADYLKREMSKIFSNIIGSQCLMEIDTRAMEQILAATWLLEDIRDINSWFKDALASSFIELRQKHSNKLSARSVVRLLASEDTFTEEHASGVLLPSRIILD